MGTTSPDFGSPWFLQSIRRKCFYKRGGNFRVPVHRRKSVRSQQNPVHHIHSVPGSYYWNPYCRKVNLPGSEKSDAIVSLQTRSYRKMQNPLKSLMSAMFLPLV